VKKVEEKDTVNEALRYLSTNNLNLQNSYAVGTYSLRPRKFRFVDKATRSPYKIEQPVLTSELSRTDPLYARETTPQHQSTTKRKRDLDD